jgi:DNA-binding transcriptional MerR regulator
MKTGKVARALKLDPNTVRDWTDQPSVTEYFTGDARSKSANSQRTYHPEDQIVLNTIRILRNVESVKDWDQIAAILKTGRRDMEMPDSFYTVEGPSAVIQYTQLAVIRQERDDAVEEVKRLRHDLDAARLQAQEREDRLNRLSREHEAELNRSLGELGYQVKMLEKRIKEFESKED